MSNTPELIKSIPLVDADGQELNPKEVIEDIPFKDFDMYQMLANQIEPKVTGLAEILIGLSAEFGEFMGYHKRLLRGDYKTPEQQSEALAGASKELGDMLWNMSEWCTMHKMPFGEIPYQNLEKLRKRMEQSKILGSGGAREEEDLILSSPVEDDMDCTVISKKEEV